jgi:hypothetical protein
MGFSSVPRLPGWSFQQRICGGVLPPPHCPDKSGPAVSPTDTLRKDSALTPVTSQKSTLFLRAAGNVRFFKGLKALRHPCHFNIFTEPFLPFPHIVYFALESPSYLPLIERYSHSKAFKQEKCVHKLLQKLLVVFLILFYY